ncbi:MAG: hypothetical protein JO206_06590, partial [Solirubrobacterales bacterium]|nr:hypothetical protein [Solirubrobacterales bacterium]MBV9472619.1 hypothetical protein [Solirubrobacterales bacterium]
MGIVALAALVLGACARAAPRPPGPVQRIPSSPARVGGGRPAHVAVVLMENAEYTEIIGSSKTPYINGLARRYALASGAYA